MGANSFLYEMTPIYLGANNENDRVASPESVHYSPSEYIKHVCFGERRKEMSILLSDKILICLEVTRDYYYVLLTTIFLTILTRKCLSKYGRSKSDC